MDLQVKIPIKSNQDNKVKIQRETIQSKIVCLNVTVVEKYISNIWN